MPTYQLIPEIPNHSSIKNIIFDFGGVICDLDIPRTEAMFRTFGPPKKRVMEDDTDSSNQFNLLVAGLETDRISPQQFRDIIRDHYENPPTDQAIDDTWNAMLVGIPDRRIKLLKDLKSSYRTFLLSNSNRIHYAKYIDDFRKQTGLPNLDPLFEKVYFSFEIGMKKPDKEIFEFVLNDSKLVASETMFIDDMQQNICGAQSVGLLGHYLSEGVDIWSLFK
jgi:glucose-1-phosphatase